MSPKPLTIIKLSPSHSNNNQKQQQTIHLSSALLPKIKKTTTKIKKKSQNQNKVIMKEVDEGEKRKKLAIVINDYMQNYKTKQKGSFLVFAQQSEKLKQRNIKIEGLSHHKFVNAKSTDFKKPRSSSLGELPRKIQTKQQDHSFIEKIRNQGKVYSIKSIKSKQKQKINSEPNSNRASLSDLKGYILKAKKSSFDSKQLNLQKGKKRGKEYGSLMEGHILKMNLQQKLINEKKAF